MIKQITIRLSIILMLFFGIINVANSQYLKRSISRIAEVSIDISTPTAHYQPMFGVGDNNSAIIEAIERFGVLTIDSSGTSNPATYAEEEIILFVLNGTGRINYDQTIMPISQNDFMYIPVGTEFSISNPREKSLKVVVIGFKIFPETQIEPTERLMIANTSEVAFQVLGQHGPTTLFQLLMGTTRSRRDRLAAAYQANSLFIMDFAATGTNIPHKHEREEEIYLILEGEGDIVAGEEPTDSTEIRHPAKAGDAFFFAPSTLIGFYNTTRDGEEHAKILAVRFRYPRQPEN
ncbi:MAG TPA: cupin domain-containing protein [Draconibacterium sp.]|nr:cupin domain-containing protein [Draconibacterium sp.]